MSYSRRGGPRLGAGRPRKFDAIHHDPRPVLTRLMPLHVDLTFLDHVWNLRTQRCFAIIAAALATVREAHGLRVVGFSVQANHLHLLVEAMKKEELTRAIQALKIRIAKGLKRRMGRKGPVFDERYFVRVLRTPTEVRRAQDHIWFNTAKHAAEYGKRLPADHVDPYTIGYFGPRESLPPSSADLVVAPTHFLLRQGWRLAATNTTARSPASPTDRVGREGSPAPRSPAPACTSLPAATPSAAPMREGTPRAGLSYTDAADGTSIPNPVAASPCILQLALPFAARVAARRSTWCRFWFPAWAAAPTTSCGRSGRDRRPSARWVRGIHAPTPPLLGRCSTTTASDSGWRRP